jgi:hypothetical protein
VNHAAAFALRAARLPEDALPWGSMRRALVEAVADWSRASGCGELASDALLENRLSHAAHLGCGFEETGRVVFFRRALAP